jgi:transposase
MSADDSLPDDVATLKAILVAERAARIEAEAKARSAEAKAYARALEIAKLKFAIAKLRHQRFGQSAERGALIEQLELQLADLEETAAEAEASAEIATKAASIDSVQVRGFERKSRRAVRCRFICRASASSIPRLPPAHAAAGCCASSART